MSAIIARLKYTPGVWVFDPPANMKADMRTALWRGHVEGFVDAGQGILCWRQNTGAASLTGRGGRAMPVRFGVPGTADIIGVMNPGGRWFAVEAKSRKTRGIAWASKQTPDQEIFESAVALTGGFYALCRSADDVEEAVQAAFAGETKWPLRPRLP